MPLHLSPELLLLGVLFAASYITVGLPSLWAATSPKRRSWRVAVVLGVLCSLLLVPAAEPCFVFVLQAGLIVAAVGLLRRRDIAGETPAGELSGTRPRRQFSTASLLWLTLFAAIVAALVRYALSVMLYRDIATWGLILVWGIYGAAAVLIGFCLVTTRRRRIVWTMLLLAGIVVTAVASWVDEWLNTASGLSYTTFVPDSPGLSVGIELRWSVLLLYGTILVSVAAAVALVSYLHLLAAAARRSADQGSPRRPVSDRLVRTALVVCVVGVAAFPSAVLWRLLHPRPLPQTQLPDPNGWDDIVAAGATIGEQSPMLNHVVEPASTQELAAEVAKFAGTYDRIRLGLSRPSQVPVWPLRGDHDGLGVNYGNFGAGPISSLRAAARALQRDAELAERQGRFSDAAKVSIEMMQLGHRTSHGGIILDHLVATAVEGVGQASLYRMIPRLDAKSCDDAIRMLRQVEESREPIELIIARDRTYNDHGSYGWIGRLHALLEDWQYGGPPTAQLIRQRLDPQSRAVNRLLTVELALRQFRITGGHWPERLEELTPELLAEVPTDPFSPTGAPLQYRRRGDGYQLYSLGADDTDVLQLDIHFAR